MIVGPSYTAGNKVVLYLLGLAPDSEKFRERRVVMIVKERRQHTRVVLEGSEVYLPEGHIGRLINASMNGLAFEEPAGVQFEEGDRLEVTLTYQGKEITGEAVVRHVTNGLVGCEWLEFKDDEQRRAYYSWLMFGQEF